MASKENQSYSPEPKVNRRRISSFKSRDIEATFHSPQKAKTGKNGLNDYSSIYTQLSLINTTKNERRDAFGTKIVKGSRNHKVSFVDQITSDVELVVYLEIPFGDDNDLNQIKIENMKDSPNKIATYGLNKEEKKKRNNEKEHTQCSSCVII